MTSTTSNALAALFKAGLLLTIGLMGVGCEEAGEIKDDFDSSMACNAYCDKKFDCANTKPTSEEDDACVSDCRNSIEDNCGNEHQEAATEQIEECVDMGCTDFQVCMVFDVAPECFGFTSEDQVRP